MQQNSFSNSNFEQFLQVGHFDAKLCVSFANLLQGFALLAVGIPGQFEEPGWSQEEPGGTRKSPEVIYWPPKN